MKMKFSLGISLKVEGVITRFLGTSRMSWNEFKPTLSWLDRFFDNKIVDEKKSRTSWHGETCIFSWFQSIASCLSFFFTWSLFLIRKALKTHSPLPPVAVVKGRNPHTFAEEIRNAAGDSMAQS